MRIQSLKAREDFYKILDSTLLKIKENKTLSSYLISSTEGTQERIVNEFLNFITANDTPVAVFKGLYREYSFTNVYWKKPIQKTLAYLAIQKRTRHIFCQKKITIPFVIDPSILIIGGNHRLRFLDYNENKMIVVLKDGESLKMINSEIALRKDHVLSYAPKLMEYGETWLIEENVLGKPVNRYQDPSFKNEVKSLALKTHYKELVIPTTSYKKSEEYLSFIKEGIIDFISKLNDPTKFKNLLKEASDFIEHLGDKINNSPCRILPVSKSHGDFQVANILAKEDKTFVVIDWESTDLRFSFYDDFVLKSNIRQRQNPFELIRNYSLQLVKKKDHFSDFSHPGFLSEIDTRLIFEILVLEEFRYRISNGLSNNYKAPSKNILAFISAYNSLRIKNE